MLFIQAATNQKNLKLFVMKLNLDLLKKVIPYTYQIASTGLILALLVIVLRQQKDIETIRSRVNNIPTSSYDLSGEIRDLETKLESVERSLSNDISSARNSISNDISSAESSIKWDVNWRCN